MNINDNKYKAIEPEEEVPFGSGTLKAIASWSDGYDTISAIEDDKCIVFILHSSRKPLMHIPAEIIKSLIIPIETELSLSMN